MQRRVIVLTIFIFLSLEVLAQPVYPKYYFRNPLDVPMQLAANFGELRAGHWHMGLDIRTKQKENLLVHAAADGYIAHVGIRPQSFGRYIIINHPNGFSTLYAHLNDFFPALEQYVTAEQYKRESWTIELDFTNQKFPVFKNQFIAYSGNTGGSQGPHLHFEIRDTKTDRCINPLFFGLPIEDDVPPNIVRLALYDHNYSVYEQTASFFSLKNTDSGYIIPAKPVLKTGLNKLSFAIQAYDRMTGSANPNGIYAAQLYFDGKPQIGFFMDSIDYKETQYINAHIDYKYRYDGGAYFQHLSQLPGDHGIVYKKINGDGVISLQDTDMHIVRIEVKDAYRNSSSLNFTIQYNDSLHKMVDSISYSRDKNKLQKFIPNNVNVIERQDFEMYLPEFSLYDTVQALYFRNNSTLSNAVTAAHQVNDASMPLHEDLSIRIKPDRPIPDRWKDKIVIQRNYRTSNTVHKAAWEHDASTNTDWLVSKFDDFGTYQAFADTIPPQINELGTGDTVDLSPATRIVFQPIDNSKAVRKFRAELDGQWLRFTNDKSWSYIYIFDDRCPFGIHELKVTVEDLVGNIITKSWLFKRYPYTPPKKKMIKKKAGGKKTSGKKPEAGGKKSTTIKTANKK